MSTVTVILPENGDTFVIYIPGESDVDGFEESVGTSE